MSESPTVLLGTLIERWRNEVADLRFSEPFGNASPLRIAGILQCADELEAALATLPLHQWGDECVNDARVCQRCGARWVVGHEPEGPCVALPPAPPQAQEQCECCGVIFGDAVQACQTLDDVWLCQRCYYEVPNQGFAQKVRYDA